MLSVCLTPGPCRPVVFNLLSCSGVFSPHNQPCGLRPILYIYYAVLYLWLDTAYVLQEFGKSTKVDFVRWAFQLHLCLFFPQVELVNIGAADIVDGNHKLILGLIWSIILHWQVCASDMKFAVEFQGFYCCCFCLDWIFFHLSWPWWVFTHLTPESIQTQLKHSIELFNLPEC